MQFPNNRINDGNNAMKTAHKWNVNAYRTMINNPEIEKQLFKQALDSIGDQVTQDDVYSVFIQHCNSIGLQDIVNSVSITEDWYNVTICSYYNGFLCETSYRINTFLPHALKILFSEIFNSLVYQVHKHCST